MAYHLIIKHQNEPFRKILENFYKIFENKFLIKIDTEENNKIIWSKEKENELRNIESLHENNENPGWTILPPGYASYNSLIKINKSTAKIIKSYSKKGFLFLKIIFIFLEN